MSLMNEIRIAFNLPLYEMANLKPQDTGLDSEIWVDPEGSRRKVSHSKPRLKLKKGSYSAVISIEPNPKILRPRTKKEQEKTYREFNDAIKYVGKYNKYFLAHYYGKLTDRQLFKKLEEVGALR